MFCVTEYIVFLVAVSVLCHSINCFLGGCKSSVSQNKVSS